MSPTQIDLAPLEALHAAATPGKRRVFDRNGKSEVRTADCLDALIATYTYAPNAKSDAAIHNDFPALAAELNALRARIRELEPENKALIDHQSRITEVVNAAKREGAAEWLEQEYASAFDHARREIIYDREFMLMEARRLRRGGE